MPVSNIIATSGGAAAVPSGRDYFALLNCEHPDGWLPSTLSEVEGWLRDKKRWDVSIGSDGEYRDGERSLLVHHHENRAAESLRVVLVEARADDRWTTELIACDRRGDGDWIELRTSNAAGRHAKVPGLARQLLTSLPFADGGKPIADHTLVVGERQIEDLRERLTDVERRGLVFVAGTGDELPFDDYLVKLDQWSRDVWGMAQVVVLTPSATEAFMKEHKRLAVLPWTIRTYYPGVALDGGDDGRRHKMLSTNRLATEHDAVIQSRLGRIARFHSAQAPVPRDVIRLHRDFARIENRRAVEAPPTVVSHTVPAFTTYSNKVSGVPLESKDRELREEGSLPAARVPAQISTLLGVETLNDVAVDRLRGVLDELDRARTSVVIGASQLERAEARIEELQTQVEQEHDALLVISDLHLDLQFELDEDRARSEDLDARCRWYVSQLKDRGAWTVVDGAVPSEFTTAYPGSFQELCDRLHADELPGVELSGKVDPAVELDDIDGLDTALRSSWDVLLTLGEYVRACVDGVFSGGVDQYLRAVPDGYRSLVSPKRHAIGESEQTMARFGSDRVFSVPTVVDSTGSATMVAHFKLAQVGLVSPRLYYLDRSTQLGTVYVGYIGPHLRNTQTN